MDLRDTIKNELKELWLDKRPTPMNELKASTMARSFDEFCPTHDQISAFCRHWREEQDSFPSTKDFKRWIMSTRRNTRIGRGGCPSGFCDGSGFVMVIGPDEIVEDWLDGAACLCKCHNSNRPDLLRLSGLNNDMIDKALLKVNRKINPLYRARLAIKPTPVTKGAVADIFEKLKKYLKGF